MEKIPELDGIRGIAVVMPMIFHAAPGLLASGWLGVDVFFVLSGYLITSILINEYQNSERINLARFFARRALRLLPALIIFLLVYLLVNAIRGDLENDHFYAAIVSLFYMTNFAAAFSWPIILGPLTVTWTLSAEEQFYLLWPIFLKTLIKKISLKAIGFIILTAIALIATHRAALFMSTNSILRCYYGPDTRADALLVGCVLSIGFAVYTKERIKRIFWLPALGSCSILACYFAAKHGRLESEYYYLGGLTLFSLGIAVILGWIIAKKPTALCYILTLSPLMWLGRISYSVYLWHVFVINIRLWQALPHRARVVADMLTTIIIAAVSYYGVERYFLKVKDALNEPISKNRTLAAILKNS